MREQLKSRRHSVEKSNNLKEYIMQRLDPLLYNIATYYAEKENKTRYDVGKWMLCMSMLRKDGIVYLQPTYWHNNGPTIGRALRMIIYGFIKFDIHDEIVLETKRFEHIDIFDTELNKTFEHRIIYKFRPYAVWKRTWIRSLFNTAMDFDDMDVFEKILERLPSNTYNYQLNFMLNNGTIPTQFKALIMKHLAENNQTEIEL